MCRKSVPADNKCLYTAIGYCLEKRLDMAPELKEICANIIKSNPELYNSVLLEMPNGAYVTRLLKDETWGTAQEISILSEYFGIEIVVILIQTCEIQRFGIDKNYPQRIFLLYDGIHYDPLIFKDQNTKNEMTMFSTKDEQYIDFARELAIELNKKMQFVDTAKFSLRCGDCYEGLIGQKEALEHAKKTGHTNFQQTK